MEINSEFYNNINGAQFRDAQELLGAIKKDGVERADLIVDVGSGSGNVTALLSKAVPHTRIVAFDIEDQMVDFARKQAADDATIEFHVDDISQPFEKLSPALRSLEGQVDLVWSNRVLHWVKESQRPVAAANIVRLLAPGGGFYTNITWMNNLNEHLPEEQRLENEKLVKIPSAKEAEETWKRTFEQAGLESVTMEAILKEWQYAEEHREEIIRVERHCQHYYRRYLPEDMPNEEKDKILEGLGYRDLFLHTIFTPIGQPASSDGLKLLINYYLQFRVTGVKPKGN